MKFAQKITTAFFYDTTNTKTMLTIIPNLKTFEFIYILAETQSTQTHQKKKLRRRTLQSADLLAFLV